MFSANIIAAGTHRQATVNLEVKNKVGHLQPTGRVHFPPPPQCVVGGEKGEIGTF